MSKGASDLINTFFAASSCDLTPASARHVACVRYAPVSRDPEVSRHCATVLSDTELRRSDRFVSEFDRAQFIQRRAFRRFCGVTALESSRHLLNFDFKETEKGRPYLSNAPDLWFSFSSNRFGFLGAWSSTRGVGVDLEDPTRNLEAAELAHRYFSGAEANEVEGVCGPERLKTFFRYWTLKEAALKSIGEGLPFGLDAFEFELHPNLRVVQAPPDHGGPEQFDAHVLKGTGGSAALVTRNLAY